MRVVGGKFKGQRFSAPKNFPSRPTTDYAKEALFNILENRIELEEAMVLDLFSGTGSISLEFLSRNVEKVIGIEENRFCVRHIKAIKSKLSINNWDIYLNDAFRGLEKVEHQFDIIFADPPFDFKKTPKVATQVFELDLLKKDGLLIIEHGKQTDLSALDNYEATRNYGGVNFSFFVHN